MAQIETWYNQDLKEPVKVHYLHGNVFSQDNQGNILGVNVFDDGSPASLSGSVSATIIRSDGGTVAASGTLSGNRVSVAIPQAGYAVPGIVSVIVKLTSGSVVTTLLAVVATVYASSTNIIIDPGTIIPDISELIAEIEAAIASIPADYSDLWESVAPNFNPNKSGGYKKGEYVTYNGGLYRFINNHSGTWNSADAVSVDLGDELTNVRNARNAIATVIKGAEQKNYRFPARLSTNLMNIMDENGNVLSAFDYKGRLVAKDFEASRSVMRKYPYTPLICDFAIQDEDGNIAFSIVNGFAITNQRLYGKKISILGDSISTFAGWIPEGYAPYYPNGNVNEARFTWWYKLIDELGLDLVCDASWSGSSVSGDSQGTGWAGCSDARISALAGEDEETPDIILVYIGTNDWAGNVQIGSFTDKDEIPSEGVILEISKAYALMLYKIRTTYPFADVYCITSLEGRQTNDTTYPIVNGNGDTIHDVNHAISEIAHIFGCKVIDLNTSGIHFWNISAYTTDGTLHPNKAGMEIIKEIVKMYLINNYHNKS